MSKKTLEYLIDKKSSVKSDENEDFGISFSFPDNDNR